jgi:hypothetical protein
MSISYPVSSGGGGGTTIISERAQYAIPATINTTFPIVVSGSTTSQEIATIFIPPTYLYQMSGSYSLVAVGYITGASGVTGSLEVAGFETFNAPITMYDPTETGNSAMGIRFSGSTGGYTFINYPLDLGPGNDYGVSIPVMFSGSVSNYTASIYGIYLSPIT